MSAAPSFTYSHTFTHAHTLYFDLHDSVSADPLDRHLVEYAAPSPCAHVETESDPFDIVSLIHTLSCTHACTHSIPHKCLRARRHALVHTRAHSLLRSFPGSFSHPATPTRPHTNSLAFFRVYTQAYAHACTPPSTLAFLPSLTDSRWRACGCAGTQTCTHADVQTRVHRYPPTSLHYFLRSVTHALPCADAHSRMPAPARALPRAPLRACAHSCAPARPLASVHSGARTCTRAHGRAGTRSLVAALLRTVLPPPLRPCTQFLGVLALVGREARPLTRGAERCPRHSLMRSGTA